jgi:spore coat protein A
MASTDSKYDRLPSRRRILFRGGVLASGFLEGRTSYSQVSDRPTLDPNKLEPYVDSLPIPPIARPSGLRNIPADPSRQAPFFRVAVREFSSCVHRDLRPTKQWGYNGMCPGPTFEVTSDKGIVVEWANELPLKHFLPVDHTLHGAQSTKPEVRIVSHLHGGRVPPEFDGYPDDWQAPGTSAIHYYPNGQDSTHLWYHDHAIGINRLNIYAGMFGQYFVRDATEDALNLPRGEFEVPLVIFDRFLDQDCQLYYPVSGDPEKPWVPEVFGNLILVNGKLLPYLDVAPRPYRLRVLNASNGRHYYVSFLNGEEFYQIGSDQGLLEAPVPMRILPIAPGERADLIVDFSRFSGRQIVVKNDAMPVMQFRVKPGAVAKNEPLPAKLRPVTPVPEKDAVKTRVLTLGEMEDRVGNPMVMLLNGMHWDAPVTEKPLLNSTEIWNLVNLTDDTHPIHLHLVRFQILDRCPFDRFTFQQTKELRYFSAASPPEPNEHGWKDTVRAHAKMVTRIIIPFRGYPGRYVWLCHILEHEDNDMMRPLEIVPA